MQTSRNSWLRDSRTRLRRTGPMILGFAAAWILVSAELSAENPPGPPPWRPNPHLSFLPAEATPDWTYWRSRLEKEAQVRRFEKMARQKASSLDFFEMEPPGLLGENDHPLLAEPLPGFGARPGQTPLAAVMGRLLPLPAPLLPPAGPDGAIPLAHPLLVPSGSTIAISQVIGDGPFGGSGGTPSGDFDFVALSAAAGQRIEVAVRTPLPFAPLDPIAALYDATGRLLAFNDNLPIPGFLGTLDSYLAFTTRVAGTYFVAVGGHGRVGPEGSELDMLPADPFDAGSGPGIGSEGTYELLIALDAAPPPDIDVFQVELEAGDVIGATVLGSAGGVALVDASNQLLVAAADADLSAIYPDASPLPGGGRATIARVIDRPGTYGLAVSRAVGLSGGGDGAYRLEMSVWRPPLDGADEEARQILFLDFDGAQLDLEIFGLAPRLVTLSPLHDFLPRWGLSAADEEALIDAIVEAVEEDLSADLRASGKNGDFAVSGIFGDFDIEIRNSRDHPDPFGGQRVSRVIVGGSIAELLLETIGIAQSVDVGNFATDETAVVLLDLLSAPAPDPNSLNSIPRAPGGTMLDLVGGAVGNIVAHEAGHLFANFHTARDVGPATIMDRGGDVLLTTGVGEDGAFGSADDLDVDFGPDLYEPNEAFAGEQETLESISFGLPAAGARAEIVTLPAAQDFAAVALGDVAQRVSTIANRGQRDLQIFPAPRIEPGGTDFSIVGGGGGRTLAPGESHDLVLRFAPDALGPQQAVLQVASDDPGQPLREIPLAGRGGTPTIGIDALEHDFGDLFYGDATISRSRDFLMDNAGPGELEIGGLVFVGPRPGGFRIGARETAPIPAGESAELTVLFHPGGAVGPFEASLVILSQDPSTPRLEVRLAGRAFGPDIDVNPGSPFFFGQIRVGVHRTRRFAIRNAGNRDLSIGATALFDNESGDFTLESGAGARLLAPGAEDSLVVGYTPSLAAESRAVLRIESNDPDERPVEIELLGLGVEPDLVVEPLFFDFGSVPLESMIFQPFRLINQGGERLFVSSIRLRDQGPDESFSLLGPMQPFFLLPGNESTVWVELWPRAPGELRATLEIMSDDRDEPLIEVPLRAGGALESLVEIPVFSGLGRWLMVILLAFIGQSLLRRRRAGPI